MKSASFAAVLILFGACSASNHDTPSLRVNVAALSLPGVSKICYDLRVTNGAGGTGDTVWQRGTPGLNGGTPDADAVCSNDFGNSAGGDISYVGPCDADGAGGERDNSVTLWLDGVYDDVGAYVDPNGANAWRNPCAAPAGCTLDVVCKENADAPVTFDLTIMRAAKQGFFDVAVSFEDVFCSAKYDSCDGEVIPPHYFTGNSYYIDEPFYAYEDGSGQRYWVVWSTVWEALGLPPYWDIYLATANDGIEFSEFASQDHDADEAGPDPRPVLHGDNGGPTFTLVAGAPIELLFGADGQRKHTAVAAFACTVGADTTGHDVTTELLLTTPTVTCDNATFLLPLDGLEAGNHTLDVEGGSLRYAVYYGTEALDCGTGVPGSCNKTYYNIAFDVEDLAADGFTNCALRYAGTAIEAGDTKTFDDDLQLVDDHGQYGAVGFAWDDGETLPLTVGDTDACASQHLDEAGSHVHSVYLDGAAYTDDPFGGFDFSGGIDGQMHSPDGGTDTGSETAVEHAHVVNTGPVDGASGFPVTNVLFEFNRALTTEEGDGLSICVHVQGQADCVSGSLASPGNVTWTFFPSPALAAGTTYVADVSDTSATVDPYNWSFTTAPAARTQLRVFLTDSTYAGNFAAGDARGFAAAANDLCATDAAQHSLTTTTGWVAWIGGYGQSPRNYLSGDALPFVLLDGKRVADDFTDLVDGSLQHPIDLTPGNDTITGAVVWTGTGTDGYAIAPGDSTTSCAGFTQSTNAYSARMGFTGASNSPWTDMQTLTCDFTARLYCFEQP